VFIAIVLTIAAIAMGAKELTSPRRVLEKVSKWRFRSLVLGALQIAIATVGGVLFNPWLEQIQWVSAAGLGLIGGTVYGTSASPSWHRARHEVPFLWRTLHQVHHSPTRLELMTTYYKHPIEAATNVVLGGAALYLVLGLSPAQVALVTILCGLAEFFYHWNVTTPRWIGWFLQRPESHCLHHEEGRHTSNYGDLPVWDWLFGTLHNPEVDTAACGFGPDEQRLDDMLRFKKVA
jgi:sterol desaturase/sphingolipid hydroxylase (fatty acid hydroxylase superfamily)